MTAAPDCCPAPGTHAGVSRHRRLRQPACDRCRAWWRDYMRRRRRAAAYGVTLDQLTAEPTP